MNLPAKPELLAPAGSLKTLRYAFAYGADAVYAGQPRYSLRVRNNAFDHATLAQGIDEAHALGKRFYVVVNIAPHNAKLKTFLKDLKPVIDMAPDALIMSDPGLIVLVREHFPTMPVHLSVQANTVNWASVQFWQRLGLSRVILSRELSLQEIEEIRQAGAGHGAGGIRSRRTVHGLFRALPVVRIPEPTRCQPRHLHQCLPLEVSGHPRHTGHYRRHRPRGRADLGIGHADGSSLPPTRKRTPGRRHAGLRG